MANAKFAKLGGPKWQELMRQHDDVEMGIRRAQTALLDTSDMRQAIGLHNQISKCLNDLHLLRNQLITYGRQVED